jgi:hypothetical protein
MVVILGASACGETTFEPPDCSSLVGLHFIELEPAWEGYSPYYRIDVRDSIQLSGSLHRVDAATATFNPQGGWSCATAASSPVSGVVGFTTTNTDLLRISAGGWIHGLEVGSAVVTASSSQPAASVEISILVYGP